MTALAIVGAGASALAATTALVARGVVPEILDIAAGPPEDARALRARLAATDPESWSPADRAAARAAVEPGRDVPRKAWFGSDFAFADESLGVDSPGPAPARAFGGYSTIWGAAVMAPDAADLAGWPADIRRGLEPALARAREILSATSDGLPYGPQMAALRAAAAAADPAGAVLRPASLAVAPGACRACAMCLSGCPYGAIFDAGPRLAAMERAGQTRIVRGFFVTDVAEDGAGVTVRGIDSTAGRAVERRYSRVLFAAGALGTTRIVLRARGLYDRDAIVKDSQKILLPILRAAAPAGALDDRGLTLTGLFVDPPAPDGHAHRPHLQITGVNPMLLARLGIGPDSVRGRFRRTLLAPLLARLMVGWGGLHSDYSGTLTLRVSRGDGPLDRLTIRPKADPRSARAARAAVASFRRALRPTGTFIPPLGGRLVAPGEGNHVGGSLPMGAAGPGPSSDGLGRPLGFARVHAIDASGFPSIPATTMLLLSMANADRIAREVPLEA
ncbi:MAG: GMC family oxidoreductase N-terminal domain-containing protein [Tagaea sp.]